MMTPTPMLNYKRLTTGIFALFVGCVLNYAGDHLLGQRIELFFGLATFGGIWFLEIFVLPALVGFATSWIFGLGGKWLCYFPPLIVRLYAYYETVYKLGVPSNASLMPMGWWGFFVILAIESAAIGGVAAEIMNKRIYGRTPTDKLYKSTSVKGGVEGGESK